MIQIGIESHVRSVILGGNHDNTYNDISSICNEDGLCFGKLLSGFYVRVKMNELELLKYKINYLCTIATVMEAKTATEAYLLQALHAIEKMCKCSDSEQTIVLADVRAFVENNQMEARDRIGGEATVLVEDILSFLDKVSGHFT